MQGCRSLTLDVFQEFQIIISATLRFEVQGPDTNQRFQVERDLQVVEASGALETFLDRGRE
jgi:hypothetical protein